MTNFKNRTLALGCYGRSCRLWNRRGHGCDSCTLSLRRSLRSRLRLSWGCDQSQSFAHFGVELGHGVFVVFEELAGVFASLADALAFVAEPRAGLFEKIIVHRDVDQGA